MLRIIKRAVSMSAQVSGVGESAAIRNDKIGFPVAIEICDRHVERVGLVRRDKGSAIESSISVSKKDDYPIRPALVEDGYRDVHCSFPDFFEQFKRLGVSYGEAVEEAADDSVLQGVQAL